MKFNTFQTIFLIFFMLQISNEIVAGDTKIQIFVSIVPQEYFVKQIGGNKVAVQALVKPGNSPATYQPTPKQMAALSDATIYFSIGVSFENAFLPKVKAINKNIEIIDTRKGIKLRKMQPCAASSKHHGHEHKGFDPHIWLNPLFVKIQTHTIANTLAKIDPVNKNFYMKNYSAFAAKLDSLNIALLKALATVKGKTLLVFHPAWGYFADAYGLSQEAIELEGKTPSAKQLVRIIEKIKNDNVRFIFVQPQFSKALATKIAKSVNCTVIPIDPLSLNYIENLKKVANTIEKSLHNQK